MGHVDSMDLQHAAPESLLEEMQASADRDMVAWQYAHRFATIFQDVIPQLVEGQQHGWALLDTIVRTQLHLLSRYPDSLIARKCGADIAQRASDQASVILSLGDPGTTGYDAGLKELDFWLRSDHHRRNPGTTADLVAAGLFVALRDGIIQPVF